MKIIGIIPSRYDSVRFPGKPLADIKGKTMIRRVYEQASKSISTTIVATDDSRIYSEVESFNGEVVYTSKNHKSGTDRCAEAVLKLDLKESHEQVVVVNIQGDEPFIKPEQINELIECFKDSNTEIATLVRKINTEEELFNINIPKVVINKNSEAIYFSRSTIPFLKGEEKNQWLKKNSYFAHIGIYAYRLDILNKIVKLEEGKLEQLEGLEQLRWIENSFKIKVKESDFISHGIDTPEDLKNALSLL